VLESLTGQTVDFALFNRVQVEPTDASFRDAIVFATEGGFNGTSLKRKRTRTGRGRSRAIQARVPPSHDSKFDKLLEPVERGAFVLVNIEPLVEARDLQDSVDVRTYLTEAQFAFEADHVLLQLDQLGQGAARQVLDGR
jgi:hypothetical protein